MTQTFEAWLGIDGFEDITFVYGPVTTSGVTFGVGAEDATGTVGANFLGAIANGTPVARDERVIKYSV